MPLHFWASINNTHNHGHSKKEQGVRSLKRVPRHLLLCSALTVELQFLLGAVEYMQLMFTQCYPPKGRSLVLGYQHFTWRGLREERDADARRQGTEIPILFLLIQCSFCYFPYSCLQGFFWFLFPEKKKSYSSSDEILCCLETWELKENLSHFFSLSIQ